MTNKDITRKERSSSLGYSFFSFDTLNKTMISKYLTKLEVAEVIQYVSRIEKVI
jgi:hypothetical protein